MDCDSTHVVAQPLELVVWTPARSVKPSGANLLTPLDILGLVIVEVMALALVGRSVKNLRALAKMEPAASRLG